MSIRSQVIELLSKESPPEFLNYNAYANLVGCINGGLKGKELDNLNEFFEGVIKSLFYKPNSKYLVIVGEQGVGKTEFLRRIFPLEMKALYHEGIADKETIYSSLICNVEDAFLSKKQMSDIKQWVGTNAFMIRKPYSEKAEAEKKLTSFSVTTLTDFTDAIEQKRALIVHFDKIDIKAYLDIDKLELWRDMFRLFKPKQD